MNYMRSSRFLSSPLPGLFCVLGHIFPCFFRFKGGKGVATCGGMVFMIDWRIALILLAVFIVAVLITKWVSLGSILMAILYPVLMGLFYKSVPITLISVVFAAIVLVAHRENIKRILNGTESKITVGGKNKKGISERKSAADTIVCQLRFCSRVKKKPLNSAAVLSHYALRPYRNEDIWCKHKLFSKSRLQ